MAAVLLGPATILAGCKSDGEAVVVEEEMALDIVLAEPVAIVDSKSGNSQALKDMVSVKLIKTQAEYDALGDADIFPGVDFEKYDLVIASLGMQSTGGYSVKITALQLEGDELAVTGKSSSPNTGDMTTQALTYPYDAVVIPNTTATSAVSYID